MPLKISTFPSQPDSIQTVTLGTITVRIRLTWRQRCQAWYLDLEGLDGSRILSGARLSPGWGPGAGLLRGVAGAPSGLFYVRGNDGYLRGDLGSGLILEWFSPEELAAAAPAAAADSGIRVVL